MSKWDRDLTLPRLDKLAVISDIFDCTVDCILGREPSQDGQNTA